MWQRCSHRLGDPKGCSSPPPGAGGGRKDPFLEGASRGRVALPTPRFQTSGCAELGEETFLWLKGPGLWCLVLAAPGKYCVPESVDFLNVTDPPSSLPGLGLSFVSSGDPVGCVEPQAPAWTGQGPTVWVCPFSRGSLIWFFALSFPEFWQWVCRRDWVQDLLCSKGVTCMVDLPPPEKLHPPLGCGRGG